MGETAGRVSIKAFQTRWSGTSRPAAIIDQGLGDRDWGAGLLKGLWGLNRKGRGPKKKGGRWLPWWVLLGTILRPVVLRKTAFFCYEMRAFAKSTGLT